jgi:hypothetical protein
MEGLGCTRGVRTDPDNCATQRRKKEGDGRVDPKWEKYRPNTVRIFLHDLLIQFVTNALRD